MRKNDIEKVNHFIKRAKSTYSVIFGLLIIMFACMVLLPNDVQIAQTGEQASWYLKSIIGFILLFVSANIMQPELIEKIRKVPKLHTFGTHRRSYGTTFVLAAGMFLIIEMLKMFFTYVPFAWGLVQALFVLGYLYLMKKLTRSKSTMGKVLFFIMALLVFLVVFFILAFTYLTRPG